MAGGKITATLVVQFGGAGDGESTGSIKAEIDQRPDGLNAGKTQFGHDDQVGFLVFLDQAVVDQIVTTADSVGASISPAGSGLVDIEETVTFDDAAEAQLGYPYGAGLTAEWIGNSGGTITATAGKSVITIPAAVFAMAKVSYRSPCRFYRLGNVPENIDEVTIKVIGHGIG